MAPHKGGTYWSCPSSPVRISSSPGKSEGQCHRYRPCSLPCQCCPRYSPHNQSLPRLNQYKGTSQPPLVRIEMRNKISFTKFKLKLTHAVHLFRDIGCAKARLAMLPRRRRRQPLMLNIIIVVWLSSAFASTWTCE